MTVSEFALGDAEVREIDRTLAELEERAEPIELHFSNHWEDDDENPALLSLALLGSLADKRLTVDAADDAAVEGLLRFGVATALSRRSEGLTRFVGRTERLDPTRLRTLWTPAALNATDALFADSEPETAGAYGPLHATFVNPHLSSGADGLPDVVFLIRRWLTKRLPQRHQVSEQELPRLVETVGVAVDETVRNVQEHAAGPDRPTPNCLLRISLGSPGQIRCSILDSGIGLAASLEDKEVEPDLEPKDRVAKLLAGEIPGWDAGRGLGLAYAAEKIEARGGRIAVATDRIRVERGGGEERRADGFELNGTVLDFTVPTAAA